MTIEQAAKLTITTMELMDKWLSDGFPDAAVDELDKTVYTLISFAYYGTAWDLIGQFYFLSSKYA